MPSIPGVLIHSCPSSVLAAHLLSPLPLRITAQRLLLQQQLEAGGRHDLQGMASGQHDTRTLASAHLDEQRLAQGTRGAAAPRAASLDRREMSLCRQVRKPHALVARGASTIRAALALSRPVFYHRQQMLAGDSHTAHRTAPKELPSAADSLSAQLLYLQGGELVIGVRVAAQEVVTLAMHHRLALAAEGSGSRLSSSDGLAEQRKQKQIMCSLLPSVALWPMANIPHSSRAAGTQQTRKATCA